MKKLLQIAGIRVIALIEENIKKGVGYDGTKFAYSDKPFYRPYDHNLLKKLGGKNGLGKYYNVVTSKTGKLGMIILGGYKEYKRKVYPSAFNHFLTVSGKMLRSMNLKVNDSEAIISFTGEDNINKAFWLNVSGAGRSRKLWKFLGISNNQLKELSKDLTDEFYKITAKELAKITRKS
jgi:hypothetical protein